MHRSGITWLILFAVIVLMILRLPPMIARQDTLVNTYGPLVEVDALARKKFVAPVQSEKLVRGAIRGMMRELDPYSGYIPPEQLPAFLRRSAGHYVGIGVEIGFTGGRLSVIAPVDAGPAARAGIRSGDILIEIAGRDVTNVSVFDAEELLIGPAGSSVDISLLRPGIDEPIRHTMRREPIELHSVRGLARDERGEWRFIVRDEPRIAYARVSIFHKHTTEQLLAALEGLSPPSLEGLIIDLRFNPGGIMLEAVEMIDAFVRDGLVLQTVTRRRAVDSYLAHEKTAFPDLPIVVLVNGGSASSAEIVAGSLQARGRATLVGSRTYGKGSVQHLVELHEHDAAVKLTVAYYRLPDGRVIHRVPGASEEDDWGVLPDEVVLLSDDEEEAVRETRRTLDRSAIRGAKEVRLAKDTWTSPPSEPLIDRQLRRALEVVAEHAHEHRKNRTSGGKPKKAKNVSE